MIAVEIDGPVGVRFIGCRFESEGLGILAVGGSELVARGCEFSVGDQPVFFDSDGALTLEKNTWLDDGADHQRTVYIAPTEWLVSRIVERHFVR